MERIQPVPCAGVGTKHLKEQSDQKRQGQKNSEPADLVRVVTRALKKHGERNEAGEYNLGDHRKNPLSG